MQSTIDRKSKKKAEVNLIVAIPLELKERFQLFCKANGVTMTTMTNVLIRTHLDRNGVGKKE